MSFTKELLKTSEVIRWKMQGSNVDGAFTFLAFDLLRQLMGFSLSIFYQFRLMAILGIHTCMFISNHLQKYKFLGYLRIQLHKTSSPVSLSISWKYLIEWIRFLKGRPKQNNLLVPENAAKLELEKGQEGRVKAFQSLTRAVIGQIFNPDPTFGPGPQVQTSHFGYREGPFAIRYLSWAQTLALVVYDPWDISPGLED